MGNIYTIGMFVNIEPDEYGWAPPVSRVVGYYTDKEAAFKAVKYNICDIWETCYDYAIVERIEEGLYAPTKDRWWFKYDRETEMYHEIEEPKEAKMLVGFTIG